MAPILVLALVVLLVCNRGGGNVVLYPTGSHRHAATVPIYLRTYSTTRGVALPGRQVTRTANLGRLTQNQVGDCPIV